MSSRPPTAAAASDDDNLDLVSSLQQEFADLVASPSEETYAPSSTERQSTNNVFLDGGESEDEDSEDDDVPTFGAFRSVSTPKPSLKKDVASKSRSRGGKKAKKTAFRVRLVKVGMEGGATFCGPIGNGNNFCIKESGCTVNSHKLNPLKLPSPPPGIYVLIEPDVVSAKPFIPLDVCKTYPELVEGLLQMDVDKDLAFMLVEQTKLFHEHDVDPKEAVVEAAAIQARETDFTQKALSATPAKNRDALKADVANERDDQMREALVMQGIQTLADESNSFHLKLLSLLGTPEPTTGQVFPTLESLIVECAAAQRELSALSRDQKQAAKKTNTAQNKLEQNTTELDKRVTDAESSLDKQRIFQKKLNDALKLCLDSMKAIKRMEGAGVDKFNITPELRKELVLLVEAQTSATSGAISLDGGSINFNGPEDLRDFCEKCKVKGFYPVMFEAVTLLGRTMDNQLSRNEFMAKELHEAKVKRSTESTDFVTSFQQRIPAVFLGKKEETGRKTTKRKKFGAMLTYQDFNAQDGRNGVVNFLNENLSDTVQRLKGEVEDIFDGHPEMITLGKTLLKLSVNFVEELMTFMERKRRELLTNCHGAGPYTKEEEKSVWDLMLLLFQAVWDTLWTHRAGVVHAYQRDDTADHKYLYAVLSQHMEMEKFIKHRFAEHPAILPKLFNHIFEAFVSRSDFDDLEERVEELELKLKKAMTLIEAQSTKLNQLLAVGNDGKGVEQTQQKRRRNRKAKAKAEDDAEDE